jgi:carbamoyl-phosphate synthase small subunit
LTKCGDNRAILALADGTIFSGRSIGANGISVGEVVFNTAITGYQEILTDPSYAKQIVTLTHPHVGNVGTNSDDEESSKIWSAGLVIRDLPSFASNYRSTLPLDQYLLNNGIVGIADIDTRKLTRLIREKGCQSGCLMAGEINHDTALKQAQSFSGLKGLDLAQEVTTQEIYSWHEPSWACKNQAPNVKKYSHRFKVVAYDYGV